MKSMNEEKLFDYETYIQRRLKEINDLDERKYARELLLDGLGRIFKHTEEKYGALEQRILRELDVPFQRFHVYMTIIEKKDYDPINSFWFPVCEEDVKKGGRQEYKTFYLMAAEKERQAFFRQGIIEGIEEESGRRIQFQIRKAFRYEQAVKKLYALFAGNHIPWQAIHMGHLERFFELAPIGGQAQDSNVGLQWGKWEAFVKAEMLPLWNIEKEAVNSREFRVPCIDDIYYEHIFYLPDEKMEEDGYLAQAEGDILSIRYEKNSILLKTKQDSLKNASICRLHQGKPAVSFGYRYPVLTNERKDNLAGRYLCQTGHFLQTPMELHRKVEEMSGGYRIELLAYEITDRAENEETGKYMLAGDMNGFAGEQVFTGDKRSRLLFKFQQEGHQEDYLYESQIRYILTRLQMEFMEYKCVGVLV